MKGVGIFSVLRLRKLSAGEARRELAASIIAEHQSEMAVLRAQAEMVREVSEIEAQGGGIVAAQYVAYLTAARGGIAQERAHLARDQGAHDAAGVAFSEERAGLRAAELLAVAKAKREAKIAERRAQFNLEDSCRR